MSHRRKDRTGVELLFWKVVHRVLISRITHGLDTSQSVSPVLLTLLWLVILAVPGIQARVLDFTVEVNQAGSRCTVQANNNTLHWMEGEDSRPTESADVLTVVSGSSRNAPPDDKPHKSCGIWPDFNALIESISWQPLYAREMAVGYRLWLSLQGGSLSIRGFSWWPVVAGIVLGKCVYTWWHSEAPSFDQWEEQQQHRVSDLKIITCMDHPPGQSGYPQGGCGSGVSNQWTGGYNDWETVSVYMAVTVHQEGEAEGIIHRMDILIITIPARLVTSSLVCTLLKVIPVITENPILQCMKP